MRRRPAPQRIVRDQLVVARPTDGDPFVLSASAAVVWTLLSDWRTEADLELGLGQHYPTVDAAERRAGLAGVLHVLSEEGLLERSQP